MKVLIAIDEPSFAEDLLSYILTHNWKAATEFEVLHVVSNIIPGTYTTILPPALLEEMTKETWAGGERLVRKLALSLKDHFHSPLIKEQVIAGNPGPSIVSYANEKGFDLIVLGSHGRHGIERFLLGSVSYYVCAHADASVLVVHSKGIKGKESDAELLASSRK